MTRQAHPLQQALAVNPSSLTHVSPTAEAH